MREPGDSRNGCGNAAEFTVNLVMLLSFCFEPQPGTKEASLPRRAGSVYEVGFVGFVKGKRGPLIMGRSRPRRGEEEGAMFEKLPPASNNNALKGGS